MTFQIPCSIKVTCPEGESTCAGRRDGTFSFEPWQRECNVLYMYFTVRFLWKRAAAFAAFNSDWSCFDFSKQTFPRYCWIFLMLIIVLHVCLYGFSSKLARKHYKHALKSRAWNSWRSVIESKWKQRVEKACQVNSRVFNEPEVAALTKNFE